MSIRREDDASPGGSAVDPPHDAPGSRWLGAVARDVTLWVKFRQISDNFNSLHVAHTWQIRGTYGTVRQLTLPAHPRHPANQQAQPLLSTMLRSLLETPGLRLCLYLPLLTFLLRLLNSLPLLRRRRLSAYLLDKHLWVTGASQGLGLAIAKCAASHGARVTLTARSPARLAAAARAVGAPAVARWVAADVGARGGDLRAAYAEVEAGHGAVDVVVANAGVNNGGRPFEMVGDEEAERVVNTNLVGVVRCFKRALPGMCERRRGVLCAVSSLVAYRGLPGASVYGASKAGVSAFCQSLGVELVASGVGVVCVHPGFVETPAIEGLEHPKPCLVSAEEGAEAVLDAIACGRRHLGFPWLMENVVMRFSTAVPSPLYEWILHFTGDHRAHYKTAAAGSNKVE